MDKARQYPAIGLLGWTSLAARGVSFLSALAIIVAALTGKSATIVPVFVPIFCSAAITLTGIALTSAFRTRVARWGKYKFDREQRPIAFWLLVLLHLAVFMAYSFVFLITLGILA